MASIIQVNGKWRALVRRKGHKPQCKTLPTKAAADAWARRIESGLDEGPAQVAVSLTVAQVIQAYRELREGSRPISDRSNEHYQLRMLEEGLGKKVAAKVTPQDLVNFAKMRRESDKAGPHTINMDVSKLGTVFRYGGAALGVALPDVVAAARPTLTYLRLIGDGGKRERRPTEDELTALLAYFDEKHPGPASDAIRFAAINAVRLGELEQMRWDQIDEKTRIVTIMRKHPRKGKTLERTPILPEAWEVLQRQPRTDERVFPINGQTLSMNFTKACRALSIPDLRFHDLRHEGTSAMFEAGMEIQQVAMVTGHKSWNMLKRYTNLKPESVSMPKTPAQP